MTTLTDLEKFMRLLHATQKTKRVARVPDEKELSNVGQHMFEVAMVAWYIISTNKLDLDVGRVLRYALAHDLIEGLVGDIPMHAMMSPEDKAAHEEEGFRQLQEAFPEFPDLIETIKEYEALANPEACFAYACDKLVDPLNGSMETTQAYWKDYPMTFDYMVTYKNPKIAKSEHIVPYWQELLKKLESRREFLFPN